MTGITRGGAARLASPPGPSPSRLRFAVSPRCRAASRVAAATASPCSNGGIWLVLTRCLLLYAGAFKRQAAKGLFNVAGVVVKADDLCLQALTPC
jgi:hypothetical protein